MILACIWVSGDISTLLTDQQCILTSLLVSHHPEDEPPLSHRSDQSCTLGENLGWKSMAPQCQRQTLYALKVMIGDIGQLQARPVPKADSSGGREK